LCSEALDPKFREFASDEIERFRPEIIERTGDRQQADNITDQELLREVMNTVGKPGRLGESIRCVVSVSMLTEGWDANTVIACEWKMIRSVPKVRLLPGETSRSFVLDHKMEVAYLEACPAILRDVAILMLGTGLREGETVGLRWADIHLEPAGDGRYSWLQVCDGKSKNAQRTVPLNERVRLQPEGRS
jgi:integrase